MGFRHYPGQPTSICKYDSQNCERRCTLTPNLPSKMLYIMDSGHGKDLPCSEWAIRQFTVNSAAKPRTVGWWTKQKQCRVESRCSGSRCRRTSLVPSIADHEFIQAKCATTNQANPRAMIWAMLQQHTVMDCDLVKYTKRTEPLLFRKNADSVWQVEVASLNELIPEVRQFVDRLQNIGGTVQQVRRTMSSSRFISR